MEPAWLTEDVQALAMAAHEDAQRFGCDCQAEHLVRPRSDGAEGMEVSTTHAPSCWVSRITEILGPR